MSMGRRLARLEGATPCPECGGPQAVEYEVVWAPAPELCPGCGEPLEIVVGWGDPEPGPERQA